MTEKKRNFDDTGALWVNDNKSEWNSDFVGVIKINGVERKIHAKEVISNSLDPVARKRQPAIRIFVLPECM